MSDRHARVQRALERFRAFRHHDQHAAATAVRDESREREMVEVRDTPTAQTGSTRPLDELRDEARYHRERYELYRAKVHSSRPTSVTRLRELERTSVAAQARFERASR